MRCKVTYRFKENDPYIDFGFHPTDIGKKTSPILFSEFYQLPGFLIKIS